MVSILIVDADTVQAEALALQVSACGYRMAALARCAEEAIEQVHALAPDIVLMDIALPGKLDGVAAAQKIREFCDIPILCLSADEARFQLACVNEPFACLLIPATLREIKLSVDIALYRHKTEKMAREILEKTVAERTAELERAQSIAHIGSWNYNLLAGQLTWSDELYRIYGVSRETFTPTVENLISLIHPDDRSAMQAWIAACMSGQEPGKLEFRCIWPDHTVHDIEGQGRLMLNAEGLAAGMSGTGRDITELKLLVDELERTRNQQKLILDSAAEGIYGLDLQGRTTFVNPAAARMLGWPADELIGQSMHDLLHHTRCDGSPHPKAQCPITATLKDGATHAVDDDLFFRKDGSSFSVEYLSAPKYINGVISGAVVTFNDISKRKLAEEALRVAAVTFETQDAILITDVDANIIRVNRAFSEVTGYTTEEVQGKNPRFMASGKHDRNFYIEMWQDLLHAGSWAGEIWDRRKNGELFPKWMSVSAVKNERQEITHYVAIFSDITARKRVEEEIHHLAFYDALTRLPNRRLLLDRLQTALNASSRRNDYGAVMFIDLDHFKELNDTLGHDYGDLLLIEVGARIKSSVREMDTVARYGGDEFVVLIESFSHEQDNAIRKVAQVAEKIRAALAQPYKIKGHEHHSTPSIGICLYHDNDESLNALIEHADMAMYEVKKSGRNAVRFFDPAMQQSLVTHDALVQDLQHALALQQIQLQYQVQVGKDNHPLGAEVFVRWMHPVHGMIMPCQFIPIAEESAVIIDIDLWVLNMACQQVILWSKSDKTRQLTLTVNISARLFAHTDFVNEVAEILKAHQTDPSRLKLELSERIVHSDLDSSLDKIRALRKLGCRLSIDNFGTVYSSLSFLKLLAPDQLKIHQEFVHNISLNTNDAQMARIVIGYAKSLGLDIFAEGVETEAQRTFLTDQDCNTFQGYLFGKPMPIEEFDALLGTL